MDISSLSDKEVIELYPAILGELKKEGLLEPIILLVSWVNILLLTFISEHRAFRNFN